MEACFGASEYGCGPPTLPTGVAVCEGLPRSSWITKCVTLINESGLEVAKAICHSVDADLVIDTDGKPLGDDRVAVQIAESLCEEEVPSEWMFSMHSWHITRVLLNDASLYDHDQTNIYNSAVTASRGRGRGGRRPYDSTRERREPQRPPKRESLLSMEEITRVSSKFCCHKTCLQPFPRAKIQALRSQMYLEGDVYFRKHRLLDVHRQIHRDAQGRDMITLEGIEVCPTTWYTIMGINRATYYRYKDQARSGMRAEQHGNLGLKKPRTHTLQATATLRILLENSADHMPHKAHTMESGEKVVSKCLPSSWRWNETLPEINQVNAQFNLPNVSASGLCKIRHDSFPEYNAKAPGDNFSRCGQCDKLKQLKAACSRGSRAQELWCKKLAVHTAGQRAHRELYYGNRTMSEKYPDKVVTIIHDKMDHSKTASPHFSHKNKAVDSFMKLPIAVTGMIAHGHGDIKYAHYGLDIFPGDSNHTVGSIAKLLRDLESPPKYSSRELFTKGRSSPLFDALLEGSEVCEASLPPPQRELVPATPLPPVLNLQLDNCCGDNKNRWVFAFCSLLVHKGIFRRYTSIFSL